MEFFNQRFKWLFKASVYLENARLVLRVRLFSLIKFRISFYKNKPFSPKFVKKLAPKYQNALLVFDHQYGGGSDFYLDEKLDKFMRGGGFNLFDLLARSLFCRYFRS